MIQTSNEKIKFLVDSCINPDADALKIQAKSVGKLGELNVHNSKGFSKWDTIYNSIVNRGQFYGLEPIKISRGNLWEAIAAYERETKELFLVFRMPNLKNILKYPFKGHYATIASVVNGELPPVQSELLNVNTIEEDKVAEYEKMNENLIGKFDIQPKKVILCGFSEYKFSAVIVNKWQQPAYIFDYSELIEPSYDGLAFEQYKINPPKNNDKKNLSKTKESKRRIKGLK